MHHQHQVQTRRKRQASKGGAKIRGSAVSRMARKVSREMLLIPSKPTALRRWRINWPAEWPQPGGDGGDHAINLSDSGRFALAPFRSEAAMASSIAGHSTWRWLNRLARPNHSMALFASGGKVVAAASFTITRASNSGVSGSASVKSSPRVSNRQTSSLGWNERD